MISHIFSFHITCFLLRNLLTIIENKKFDLVRVKYAPYINYLVDFSIVYMLSIFNTSFTDLMLFASNFFMLNYEYIFVCVCGCVSLSFSICANRDCCPVQENQELFQLVLPTLNKVQNLVYGKDWGKQPCWTSSQPPYPGTNFLLFTILNIVVAPNNQRMR